MAITLNSVRQFKEQLSLMESLCDEMLSSRVHDKLFTSGEELEDAKIACKFLPEQYYCFRFFEKKIEIRFHSKTKKYYLYYEGCYPKRKFQEENNLNSIYNSSNSYFIDTQDIEEAVKIFFKAVLQIIKDTLNEDLIYIY